MVAAILCGLTAGALWGVTFVAPYFIPDATAELVVIRYASYGFISAVYLALIKFNPLARLTPAEWLRIIVFGALGNTIYYILVTSSITVGSGVISAMVVGTLPVMFAIVGNIRHSTVPWSKFGLALAPILAGLFLIGGFPAGNDFSYESLIAIGLAAAAMVSWLLYGMGNADYLASDQPFSPLLWSALVGIGTLATLPIVIFAASLQAGLQSHTQYLAALPWGIALGFFSSWAATWLWNVASAKLKSVVLGYLIVSETVFALVYVLIAEGRLPSLVELISLALLVGGTILGVQVSQSSRASELN